MVDTLKALRRYRLKLRTWLGHEIEALVVRKQLKDADGWFVQPLIFVRLNQLTAGGLVERFYKAKVLQRFGLDIAFAGRIERQAEKVRFIVEAIDRTQRTDILTIITNARGEIDSIYSPADWSHRDAATDYEKLDEANKRGLVPFRLQGSFGVRIDAYATLWSDWKVNVVIERSEITDVGEITIWKEFECDVGEPAIVHYFVKSSCDRVDIALIRARDFQLSVIDSIYMLPTR